MDVGVFSAAEQEVVSKLSSGVWLLQIRIAKVIYELTQKQASSFCNKKGENVSQLIL